MSDKVGMFKNYMFERDGEREREEMRQEQKARGIEHVTKMNGKIKGFRKSMEEKRERKVFKGRGGKKGSDESEGRALTRVE